MKVTGALMRMGLLLLAMSPAHAQVAQECFSAVNPTSKAKLWATAFYPSDASEKKKYPAFVFVPGGLRFGSKPGEFEPSAFVRAGFVVGYFDPDGRGESAGSEDWNGKVHQDGLHAVLKLFAGLKFVNKDNLGVLSYSLGLALAAGALGRYPDDPPLKYFIDMEGPSDRIYITKHDDPSIRGFDGHTTKDEDWWAEREAVRSIQNIHCAYLRIQHESDHAQREDKQHAIDMIDASTNTKFGGKCQALWTRVNGAENEPNKTYTKENPPKWLPNRMGPPSPTDTLQWVLEMSATGRKAR